MSKTNNIQQELEDMESRLAGLPKEMPYHVPAGYFEQLANGIAVQAAQRENEVPDFGNKLPYTAPDGYFNDLPTQLLLHAKAADAKNGKRIPVKGRRYSFLPDMKWAAAAALAVIIGTGGYMMFSTRNNIAGAEGMLAAIPQAEIRAYVQHRYGIDAGIIANTPGISNLEVDSKDIVAYLNETGWE